MSTTTEIAPLTDAGGPRSSLGRRIGIAVFALVALVTVLALVAAGVIVWTVQRSFPQLSGTVAVTGLGKDATIQRNALGVPTIVADTTDDLFFAQGYAHAQDRFWEMDFRRHVTSGRLAELFGQSQLGTDMFLRSLGWRAIAEQEVEALDEATRGYYEAYAAGVNAYLDDHDGASVSLEYAVLGLQNSAYEIEPWTPADSVAWLKAMAWDLRANLVEETERALLARTHTPEQIAELYPRYPYDRNPVIVPTVVAAEETPAPAAETDAAAAAPASVVWTEVGDVVEAASALVGGAGEGIGSNSWVVSGDLTESGLPLLSDDPHLGASLPSVWYQNGLRCREVTEACAFDVAGFGFAGVPGVIVGHNASIAWGVTNLNNDSADLYLEKVDGDQYWRDGALVPLQTRTETFAVAGGKDVTTTVRSTVHGPIVSGLSDDFTAIAEAPVTGSTDAVTVPQDGLSGEYAVSLAWTALEPGTTARSIFAINLAQDFEQFRAAAELFDVPAQNLVYADRQGNIGYQAPGRMPIRGAGDGSMPQPGWDSSYDWQGYIPFAELPTLYNPPAGFIVTANNAVVDEAYPYRITDDWDYGWRAARIVDRLERAAARGGMTADDMSAIQADQQLWIGKRLVAAYADVEVDDPGARAALELLQQWDTQNRTDSSGAAYANVLWDELVQDLFTRRDDPASVAGQDRMFLVVDRLLGDPDSAWWVNEKLGVNGRDELLAKAAVDAYDRLVELQGDDPDRWEWGALHAITLTSGTFGSSGIPIIEWLFNRGPYPVGGGSAVVDATGWVLGSGGFATVTVPSMRMTVDLADLDASRWNHLTGASGHAFHPNYTDQFETWQHARQTSWPFSSDAVGQATVDSLTLVPRG
ncbi:penicillin acylase family protein [Microbacterium sp.]|uniref:penicillin acylase family protein n=1 Tax=Microbacterium sp. TaxID=51671 RepID=UPI0039E441D8